MRVQDLISFARGWLLFHYIEHLEAGEARSPLAELTLLYSYA